MVAPAGVGGGSAPEPATPEPASTEPVTLEPVALEPDAAKPDAAEPDAAHPDALEPVATEPLALEAAVPEQSPPAPGESVAAEVRAGERRGVSGLVVAGVILVLVAVAAAAGRRIQPAGRRLPQFVAERTVGHDLVLCHAAPGGSVRDVQPDRIVLARRGGRAAAGQQWLREPDRGLPEPAAAERGPDPAVRLPQPGCLAGGRPHRGVRGQLGQRAAQRFGPQQRLTAIGLKNAWAIGPFRRTTCPLG